MIFEFSLAYQPKRWQFMRRETELPGLQWELGPQRWQLFFFCMNGSFRTGPRVLGIKPGVTVLVPPRSRSALEISDIGDRHTYYQFTFTPVESAEEVFAFNQLNDLSAEFSFYDRTFRQTLDLAAYTSRPADPLLWHLLWRLAILPKNVQKNPYLIRAHERISALLSQQFTIRDIARELHISQNHLTNVFRQELGITPRQFIREARSDAALKMLTSTTLPIKQIAVQVGIPNLAQFNRFVHETLGASPRAIRNDQLLMRAF